MLLHRFLTALVLVSTTLVCLFAENPLGWNILVSVFVLIAWWEWINLANARYFGIKTIFFTLLLLLMAYLMYFYQLPIVVVIVMAMLWLVLLTATLQTRWQRIGIVWSDVSKLFIGSTVLAFAWSSLVWLKEQANGSWWVLGFLLIIWLADTGAYFVGKRFGKTKLAPSVSPGKTLEGMLGGLALVAIYALITKVSFSALFQSNAVILCAIIIAIVSIGGDLYESWLKRLVGIKESSNILPGHGGVLDRIDSLIAALPFMILSYIWLI